MNDTSARFFVCVLRTDFVTTSNMHYQKKKGVAKEIKDNNNKNNIPKKKKFTSRDLLNKSIFQSIYIIILIMLSTRCIQYIRGTNDWYDNFNRYQSFEWKTFISLFNAENQRKKKGDPLLDNVTLYYIRVLSNQRIHIHIWIMPWLLFQVKKKKPKFIFCYKLFSFYFLFVYRNWITETIIGFAKKKEEKYTSSTYNEKM